MRYVMTRCQLDIILDDEQSYSAGVFDYILILLG